MIKLLKFIVIGSWKPLKTSLTNICFFLLFQKKYTQGRGRRPFGLSAIIVGFDYDGTSHLYQTDPSGTYHEWKANAIGRNSNSVREFLEKNYTDDVANSDAACVKLCIRALLEVVQSGSKNVEIAVARRNKPLEVSQITYYNYIPLKTDKLNSPSS